MQKKMLHLAGLEPAISALGGLRGIHFATSAVW